MTNHNNARAVAPYAIGHPASAAVRTGSVNMRDGKAVPDVTRSVSNPCANTAAR